MYDPNGHKEKFLKGLNDKTAASNMVLFNKIANKEEEFKKDILDMSLIEIQETLQSITYKNPSMLSNFKTVLNNYFRFNNNDKIEVYDLEDFKKLAQVDGRVIYTFQEIRNYMKLLDQKIPNSWYYNTILALTFLGCTLDDLVELREYHVEEEIIRFDNGKVISLKLIPEVYGYIKKTIEKKSEYGIGRYESSSYEGSYPDSVIKIFSRPNRIDIKKAVRKSIQRTAFKQISETVGDLELTQTRVYDSGLIYYLREKLKPLSLKEVLDAPRGDYKRVQVQALISTFGSLMKVDQFKFKFKDVL